MRKCKSCSVPLPHSSRKNPSKFCSSKCRFRAYNSTDKRKASERNRQRNRRKYPDGSPQKWNRNGHWKGGRTVHGKGYIMVRMPSHPRAKTSGYVMEHILVVEEKYGRGLVGDEQVHHINGDKSDNRPENLEIVSPAMHASRHREMRAKK